MTPGTYLRKRRMAAGLSIDQAAAWLAMLPIARGDIAQRCHLLTVMLERVEGNVAFLTPEQALIVKDAFPFDVAVYTRLVLASQGRFAGNQPRLCSQCACSNFDPCITHGEACAWSDQHPHLCTSCDHLVADGGGAPAALHAAAQPTEARHG